MSAVVDMEYLSIQQAVGYIVGNPDDMRYNYNNYMIYLRRTDGKAIFIPIDNDRCFGITKDWNVREALMYDTVLSSKPSSGEQRNPLLNKTIFAQDNECKKLYLDYVNKIINSDWVKVETFDKYYTKVVLSYRKYLREDEVINRNDTNISFATYMENKIVAAKDLQNK